MTSLSLCVVDQCEFVSLALCQCCKNDLCIDHLNEHSNQRHGKLLSLVDRIENLSNRFNQFHNGEDSESRILNQWRDDAVRLVDEFCEKKRREFPNRTNNEHQNQLEQMQNTLNELIRKKGGSQTDIERFTTDLQIIEEHLNQLEHVPLVLPTLTIDEQCNLRPQTQIEEQFESTSVATQTTDAASEKSSSEQRSEKSSKKKRKSRRRSSSSSNRSSRHRSRSPHKRNGHSKRSRRSRSRGSNGAMSNCEDCHGCRFYQDRFGPGFMDAFGPCKCDCHNWAYNQN